MSKKASAPPAPDYSPILSAAQNLSTSEGTDATQQMGWAQNAYNNNLGTANQVQGADLGVQGQANNFATDIQNQYQGTYVPLENQFANEAENYASPGMIDSQMGRAEANTAQAMDQSRANAQQDLESFGISPDSTRYAALDIGQQAQKGAAVAAAGNQAYTNTVNTGLGLQAQAIGQGLVMPSMAAGMQNTGLQAGAGAANTGLATTASGASTMGTAPQYMGLQNGALGVMGQTLNSQYSNQLAQFNANQNASSGWGSILGAVMGSGVLGGAAKGLGGLSGLGGTGAAAGDASGMGAAVLMAKGGAVPSNDETEGDPDEAKPFIDHAFYVIPGSDETGAPLHPHEAIARAARTGKHLGAFPSAQHAMAHFRTQPQQQDYAKHFAGGGDVDATGGGALPAGASPSRGAVQDDIPARLNAGEFVVPKAAVEWHGQKMFYGLIEKAQKEKQEAQQKTGAVPTLSPAGAA